MITSVAQSGSGYVAAGFQPVRCDMPSTTRRVHIGCRPGRCHPEFNSRFWFLCHLSFSQKCHSFAPVAWLMPLKKISAATARIDLGATLDATNSGVRHFVNFKHGGQAPALLIEELYFNKSCYYGGKYNFSVLIRALNVIHKSLKFELVKPAETQKLFRSTSYFDLSLGITLIFLSSPTLVFLVITQKQILIVFHFKVHSFPTSFFHHVLIHTKL